MVKDFSIPFAARNSRASPRLVKLEKFYRRVKTFAGKFHGHLLDFDRLPLVTARKQTLDGQFASDSAGRVTIDC